MIKINQETGGNTPIPSTTAQTPAGKSYLLNQPIKDTVSFSGSEEQPKKKHTLAWVIGLAAAATAIVLAVKSHKKVNTGELEKAVTKEGEKAKKSGGGGGRRTKADPNPNPNSEPIATETLYPQYRKHKLLNFIDNFDKDLRNKKFSDRSREEKFQVAREHHEKQLELEKVVDDKSRKPIDKLKSKILENTSIPDEIIGKLDFNKPSEVINILASQKETKYSAEFLESAYKYLKGAKIKDPVEAERTRHSGLYILNSLKATHVKNRDLTKADEVGKLIDKEIDSLIEHHFGKNWSNTNFDEATIKELNSSTKSKLKQSLSKLEGKIQPAEIFPLTLSAQSVSQLKKMQKQLAKNTEGIGKEIEETIFKKFNITNETKMEDVDPSIQKEMVLELRTLLKNKIDKPLNNAEILNDKAIEIVKKTGLTDESMSSQISSGIKQELEETKIGIKELLSQMEKDLINDFNLEKGV